VLLVTHGVKDTSTAVYRNTLRRSSFLQLLGHRSQVLAPDDVRVKHGPLEPLLFPFAAAWFILRHGPFDVIAFHSHTGFVYQFFRKLFRHHRRTRLAVTFHGLDIMYVRALAVDGARRGHPQRLRFRLLHAGVLPRLARWSCRRANRVFYMNERERRFLLEQRWANTTQVRRMPNCVEPDDFVTHRAAQGPVRILFVAQWLAVKGISTLVEAFTTVVRKGFEVRLTCLGTRRDAAVVLPEFPEDVRASVEVEATVPHAHVRRFYASADIFVLPSVFEGFSIALLEAMAAGLAIVTTDAGAAHEILEAGQDAEIVPVADPRALASAIEGFVVDEARRRAFGDRARVRARAYLSSEILPRFAEDLLGVPNVSAATGAI
jgi:glycosyltransferase involved in cell wall biosynthesis